MAVFELIATFKGACVITVIALISLLVYAIMKKYHINYGGMLTIIANKFLKVLGKGIASKENTYQIGVSTGRIKNKSIRVKTYKLLNDICIDLNLVNKGITPYGFLATILMLSAVISIVVCWVVIGSLLLAILAYPLIFAAITCWLYTKANIAHDARIESIIMAENIIANNIKDGVKVAVKQNIDMIPDNIRGAYQDFLNDVDTNEHIRTALIKLSSKLGSVSETFIKNCITFETEEEHGMVNIFQDIVKINNIKMDSRHDMKRTFEEKSAEFIISAICIFVFLFGTMAVFPTIRHMYLGTIVGNLVLGFDALLLIGEFVFTTWLRAREL